MGPRTLDIDILLFGDQIIEQDNLSVPHPRMKERSFVLIPLNDIATKQIEPISNKSIGQLVVPDNSVKNIRIIKHSNMVLKLLIKKFIYC